jgi:hypothetical protein
MESRSKKDSKPVVNRTMMVPCESLATRIEGKWTFMMTNDMKMKSPAGFWNELPILIGSSSSGAGRARLLYARLQSTGMDEMDEIKGMW